jgi:hypothetical protein
MAQRYRSRWSGLYFTARWLPPAEGATVSRVFVSVMGGEEYEAFTITPPIDENPIYAIGLGLGEDGQGNPTITYSRSYGQDATLPPVVMVGYQQGDAGQWAPLV